MRSRSHPGYRACALGNRACRDGFTVAYKRLSRLFDELAQAQVDGTYSLVLRRLAKAQVLILDDFGLEVLGAAQRNELLEVIEGRYGISSTIVTSQHEPKNWHGVIGCETPADAICDRLIHKAHRIKLGGESLRKTALTKTTRQSKQKIPGSLCFLGDRHGRNTQESLTINGRHLIERDLYFKAQPFPELQSRT